MVKFLISLFLATAPVYTVKSDPELLPYYKRFLKEADRLNKQVPAHNILIRFGDMKDIPHTISENVVGFCHSKDNVNIITIDKAYFYSVTDLDREAVIFHELGHCVLLRAHEQRCINKEEYGVPYHCELKRSIMNPTAIQAEEYSNNRLFLLTELFSVLPTKEKSNE